MKLNITPILPLDRKPNGGKAVLEAVAKARGCSTGEEIKDFYSRNPSLDHPVGQMEDFDTAQKRIREAIDNRERVCVFGDYDVDGVTSTAQMKRFLENRGVDVKAYIPDRLSEGYGLTPGSAATCLEKFKPTLLITVDCGSLCHDAINFLEEHQVDVIVLDHHELDENAGENPALAHLNPSSGEFPQIQRICASALVFCFCDAMVRKWGQPWPERDRQLILAGIGTTCDVMPLVGLNRSLVKHSLGLINSSQGQLLLPGLLALVDREKTPRINNTTYGFTIGPCLNSAGRINHAHRALELLDHDDSFIIEKVAKELVALNDERKAMQKTIEEECVAKAEEIIRKRPETKILLLGKAEWHPGVIGIVASRIKDLFDRPVIICGKSEGHWKGSGRSVEGCNLGELVHKAVHEKILEGGGGHAAAAGVCLQEASFDTFANWLQENSDFDPATYRKNYEVLGKLEWTDPVLWLGLFKRMQPFGMGNPSPRVLVEGGKLFSVAPKKVRATGKIWATEGTFGSKSGRCKKLVWPNPRKAGLVWQDGGVYDSIVSITQSEWNGREYINFTVEDSAPAAATQSAERKSA